MTSDDLKQKGRDLLNECFGNLNANANAEYLARYWTELFQDELANVRQRAEEDETLREIPGNPIMIMTLGASLEPLILAIHLVCPEKLFVLYTSSELKEKFTGGLKDSNCEILPNGIFIQEPATSASVFKTLRGKSGASTQDANLKELKKILDDPEQRKRIVFDITGAKKTISGGCLLFAAYYDLPVYYMDFGDKPGDYHPDLSRPLPGACYYTRQKNPIAGFCLKDIEGIKEHFDKGNYAIAAELLKKTVSQKMDKDYFPEDEIIHYIGLYEKARIYNDWVNGWWGDVFQNIGSLPNENHENVRRLSAYPKKENWREPVYQTDFYDKPDQFLAYLVMELATLSRALKTGTMNPRTVFLKIYSLEELLVGFMTYYLLSQNLITAKVSINEPNGCSGLSDSDHIKLSVACNYAGLEALLIGQRTSSEQSPYKPNIRTLKDKWNRKHQHIITLSYEHNTLSDGIKNKLNIFYYPNREIRNKAVHSITPVERDTTLTILNAFEQLLKLLLADTAINWFQNAGNLNTMKELLNQENWFEDKTVAPLKWDALQ